MLAHHRQRQRLVESGLGAGLLPGRQGLFELDQGQRIGVIIGHEEVGQQPAQAADPFMRWRRRGEHAPVVFEAGNEPDQRAEQRGTEAADLAEGFDPLPGGRAIAGGVAQQHPPQAEQPAVGRSLGPLAGQAEAGAMTGVEAPAHAGTADPAGELRQVGSVDTETPSQRRHVEQVEHLAGAEARLRQAGDERQRGQQRIVGAAPLVGQAERDVTGIVGIRQAEHRLHVGRVGVDIGHHDDDVARLQAGVVVEGCEQLVVQDLDFALGSVGDVEADRCIHRRVDRRPLGAGLGEWAQFEDVVLQLPEQAIAATRLEQVHALTDGLQAATVAGAQLIVVHLVEQRDEIPPLPSPGRQQRLGMEVQAVLVQLLGHARLARLAVAAAAQQILVGDDVGPVVAARIVDAHQQLAPAVQRRQHFEGLARHRRDAEHHHPPRQAHRRRVGVGGGRHEGLVHRRTPDTSGIIDVGQQRTPQGSLPAAVGRQRHFGAGGANQHVAAGGPGGQPIGTIDLVLVEQVGQPLGELEALAPVVVVGEKAGQRRVHRLGDQRRQHPHQAPHQPWLVEGRDLRHRARSEHRAIDLPQEARRQREVEAGGDAAAGVVGGIGRARQPQLEPLGDAVALHQDGLGLERRQRVTTNPGNHQLAQGLGMVAVHQHQAAGEFRVWIGRIDHGLNRRRRPRCRPASS